MSSVAPLSCKTVTIVLPTHNRRHLVGRAICSVLGQTYGDWELIVVDDGSTDGSREVIDGFADPRIRYVRNDKPSGPSNARNTGILAASPGTGYIGFLDDDDEWLPRKLELQVRLFETSPMRPVAVGCGRIDYSDGEPEVHLPQHRGDVFEDILARRARGYGAQLILVRRELAGDLLFDVNIRCLEDAEYGMRLAMRGAFDFVPEALVKIYRNDGGPHAWNPEAAVRGYEQLGNKYRNELSERPWVRSYYGVCMARDLARLGRMQECRERLKEAGNGGSHRPTRVLAWRVASIFGVLAMAITSRLLPIEPPEQKIATVAMQRLKQSEGA